jgi:hypothetical protein
LTVGCILAAFQAHLPGQASDAFEVLVAVMLVALGTRAIYRGRLRGPAGSTSIHRPWTGVHAHSGEPEHVHVGPWTLAWRPLLVGLIHGLAGSGALTALVMAELPTFRARVAYMALFGLGSVAGMAVLTAIAGRQLRRLGKNPRIARALAIVTGSVSMGLGGWWGWTAIASFMRP